MQHRLLTLTACLLLSVTAATAQRSRDGEIRAVLERQTAAWNDGKLDEFMSGYWNSPKLTFFSAGRRQMGYDAVLERYRKTYQAEGREMGKLVFSELEIERLATSQAFVRGRWELTMSNGTKMGGLFTLIFRHFGKLGWKIIHDHTSANQ